MAYAGCLPGARAAEWDFAPTMSWSMDHASNRYLAPMASPGEGAIVTFNAPLTRSTETLQLAVQPSVILQRFTTNSGADSNNGAINFGAAWSGERSSASLSAGYSDLSTAITELQTTGVVQGDNYQRQATVGAAGTLEQSAATQLSAQLSYADVRYVGQYVGLNSYKYPSFSIGERFALSTRTSVTAGVSGSEIRSPQGGGASRSLGLSLSVEHAFSQRLQAMASIGISDLNFGTGSKRGPVGEVQLTRTRESARWTLLYQRSVSPNGFGELAVRDTASLTASRDLASRLSVNANLLATRDRQVYFFDLQESRTYASIEGTLNWRSGETSTIGLRAAYDGAQVQGVMPVPTTTGWRVALVYTWTPQRRTISR